MAVSTITPVPPQKYDPAYGGIPGIPDPSSSLASTIAGNMGQIKDIKNLGKKVSNYFWNQTTGRVPGYAGMAAQSAQNIGSYLQGVVPEDVKYQLAQGAAERGVSRGVPGSELSEADYLRSLGLTSLGLQQYGEGALTGALTRAESIPMFDISKFMLNPNDVYQSNLMANIYGAAPVPSAAARAAMDAVNKGSKTTPGQFTNMGGGGAPPRTTNPFASPSLAPYGDVGASPSGPVNPYDPFYDYDPLSEYYDPSSDYDPLSEYYDPFSFEDFSSGGYYDFEPASYEDYSAYA